MDRLPGVTVIGAGGHAKVVVATLLELGLQPRGILDDAPRTHGTTVLGVPVLGSIDGHLGKDDSAVVAVGDNEARRALVSRLGPRDWISAIHPRAWVHESVEVGAGTVVFAGAIAQPGTRLGAHAIVNTAATVDHDCRLGEFAHVAPGCHVAGEVVIAEGCLIGIGSTVIPGRRIGGWTTVGAGAVVIHDLPERCTAAGVPARVLAEAHR